MFLFVSLNTFLGKLWDLHDPVGEFPPLPNNAKGSWD